MYVCCAQQSRERGCLRFPCTETLPFSGWLTPLQWLTLSPHSQSLTSHANEQHIITDSPLFVSLSEERWCNQSKSADRNHRYLFIQTVLLSSSSRGGCLGFSFLYVTIDLFYFIIYSQMDDLEVLRRIGEMWESWGRFVVTQRADCFCKVVVCAQALSFSAKLVTCPRLRAVSSIIRCEGDVRSMKG